ncbi:unnamed protein product [Trichobilharzia regenti]|nr:unnamed protein product [Trichobilharzia regenti]
MCSVFKDRQNKTESSSSPPSSPAAAAITPTILSNKKTIPSFSIENILQQSNHSSNDSCKFYIFLHAFFPIFSL